LRDQNRNTAYQKASKSELNNEKRTMKNIAARHMFLWFLLAPSLVRLVRPVSRIDSSPHFQALSNQLEQLQTELRWLEEKMFQSRYRKETRPAPVSLVHPAEFPID